MGLKSSDSYLLTKLTMGAVRRLKTKYNEKDSVGNQSTKDLLDMEIDAAVVTETIMALAEMQSKPSGCCGINSIVMIVALCAGFAQQVVNSFGTVRHTICSL